MKFKIISFFSIVFISIYFISCTKESSNKIDNTTMYIKESSIWGIIDENDLEKKISEIDNKQVVNFGTKVKYINQKLINEKEYYRVKLPSRDKVWISQNGLSKKLFTVINHSASGYKSPDANQEKISLKNGDFGVFLQEKDDWILIDFWAFRKTTGSNSYEKIGNLWMNKKDIHLLNSDITLAKQAFFLYHLYYYTLIDKLPDMQNYYKNRTLEIRNTTGEENVVTKAVDDLLTFTKDK